MTTTPHCPKCHDTLLQRAREQSPPVYRCKQCSGMWLMPGEAELLALDTPPAAKLTRAPQDKRGGFCPFEHGLLERARVELDDGGDAFYLERCRSCSGIFFDDGEWGRLVRSNLIAHLDDLWDPTFQQRLADERSHKVWREDLIEALGKETVETVEHLANTLADNGMVSEAVAYLSDLVARKSPARVDNVPAGPRRTRKVDAVLLHFAPANIEIATYQPASLTTEGFVHLCHRQQALEVLERHFDIENRPVLAFVIDESRLLSPVKDEETGHGVFPHLYGELRADVVRTRIFIPAGTQPDEILRLLDDGIDLD